ncbi:MAG: AbrB/MazE/SpoVT family DNA-binding domain-containing protein [Candidatus Moranbacteria bacterium]|nr:AbrB/MazE/SpoVT family DNA-binding domain-containing protein [Candidatus Moranbacteria bacterium]
MTTVTVSPKFQVVIPAEIRKLVNVKPGEKFHVISFEGRIELIPVRSAGSMRGFLKGINNTFKREKKDRV